MGPEDVLLEGMRFTDIQYGDVEADLMLFLPDAGIAVIEVKGGVVSYASGEWLVELRRGQRRVQPIHQARAAKHAFRQYISRQAEFGGALPRVQWFVAMPFTPVHGDMGPEGLRDQLLGSNDLDEMVSRIRRSLRDLNDASPPPSSDDVDRMLRALAESSSSHSNVATPAGITPSATSIAKVALQLVAAGLLGFLSAHSAHAAVALFASCAAAGLAGASGWSLRHFKLASADTRKLRIATTLSGALIAVAGFGMHGILISEPTTASTCQSGYDICLPVVKDLDCKDVVGTVHVTGTDVYHLDRDGDGIGCEWNG